MWDWEGQWRWAGRKGRFHQQWFFWIAQIYQDLQKKRVWILCNDSGRENTLPGYGSVKVIAPLYKAHNEQEHPVQRIVQRSWKFPIKGLVLCPHPSHFLFSFFLLHLCILIPFYYGLKSPWKPAVLAWMMGACMMALHHKEDKYKTLHIAFHSRASFAVLLLSSANIKS